MSEAAAEMPISDARDHLADVVNRAVYAGTPTHLTRRGRRLAVVVSEAHLAGSRRGDGRAAGRGAAGAVGAGEGRAGPVTGPAYKIELEPRARKKLALLDVPVRRRVSAVIEKLANQPRPSGAVALAGRPGVLRIRAGDYRILDEIHDDHLVMLVIDIGHSREIYRLSRLQACQVQAALPPGPVPHTVQRTPP